MKREELAKLITETLFNLDPYNGETKEEMTAYNLDALKTQKGSYYIINGLCGIINELLED